MEKKREPKYKIYTNDSGIIYAVSSYEGKCVRGVAKCNPADKYDYIMGTELAKARCTKKIADRRKKRAEKKYYEAVQREKESSEYLNKMRDYLLTATKEYDNSCSYLDIVLSAIEDTIEKFSS